MDTVVQVGQRGNITVPDALRQRHGIKAGDTYYLLDLDGILVLSPTTAVVPDLAQQIEKMRVDAGLSLGEMMQSLREQRMQYRRDDTDAIETA
jgi:bifunctional DNA-binding transcriptional regulator/antitoxin component of YhaV-PrlF toxin-antitoxin module